MVVIDDHEANSFDVARCPYTDVMTEPERRNCRIYRQSIGERGIINGMQMDWRKGAGRDMCEMDWRMN